MQHNCNDIQEQLISLDELSNDHREQIRTHLKSCAACSEIHSRQQVIMNTLYETGRNSRNADDEITRYLFHLNFPGDSDDLRQEMSKAEAAQFSARLESDPLLRLRFDRQQQEFAELTRFIDESPIPDATIGGAMPMESKNVTGRSWIQRLFDRSRDGDGARTPGKLLLPMAVAVAAVVILVLTVPVNENIADPYLQLAALDPISLPGPSRDISDATLLEAHALFNNGEYRKAGQKFDLLLGFEEPGSGKFAELNYKIGLAALYQDAASGEEPSPTASPVLNRAISNLKASLAIETNSRNKANALWYLGKAELRRRNQEAAAACMRSIIELRGLHYDEAAQLLQEIENNLISSD